MGAVFIAINLRHEFYCDQAISLGFVASSMGKADQKKIISTKTDIN